MLRGVFLEEIAHVELVQTTINQLLNGADLATPGDAGADAAPIDEAVKHANPHHFIMGAKSSLPVDAGGNPWNGSWVYSHGNLISDMLNNIVLEPTGVLQKTRIYEMSSNKTFRETLGFLIVRDNAHQKLRFINRKTTAADYLEGCCCVWYFILFHFNTHFAHLHHQDYYS